MIQIFVSGVFDPKKEKKIVFKFEFKYYDAKVPRILIIFFFSWHKLTNIQAKKSDSEKDYFNLPWRVLAVLLILVFRTIIPQIKSNKMHTKIRKSNTNLMKIYQIKYDTRACSTQMAQLCSTARCKCQKCWIWECNGGVIDYPSILRALTVLWYCAHHNDAEFLTHQHTVRFDVYNICGHLFTAKPIMKSIALQLINQLL